VSDLEFLKTIMHSTVNLVHPETDERNGSEKVSELSTTTVCKWQI
jgi:hypothetical protein